MMPDAATVVTLGLTFLLAGTVKGVIGLGLPTVSLALLAIAFDLTTAMALLLVPSALTNLWQALVGGHFTRLLRRLWPMLTLATLTVWIGALALTRVDLAWLTALLGLSIALYAALSLSGLRARVKPGREAWIGPLAGIFNGVLTGMTGSFVVPGVMYLQALGLARDQMIQAMGILFTLSTLALAAVLANRFLSLELAAWSCAALLPALLGMLLGQKIRRLLSERVFRRVFFSALLVLGIYILASALIAG